MLKKKCLLLLPTTYKDGKDVPPSVFSGVLRSIEETLDCYTVDGLCDGVYKMDDGAMARDRSVKVWAVVDPGRVDELRTLAARIAAVLKQETLYFEVTDVDFDLVRPSLETGELL